MSYYIIMNDFDSSLVPRNLQGVVDENLKINENWKIESSIYSFPYRITDDACPENIFLLCEKNVGALKFDYYKKDYGHFLSKEMFDIFSKFTCSTFFNRKITPVSIGNGHVLRDYFRYVYFPGNGILDEKKSLLEEDKFGDIIPFEIKFNASASQYDIFSFRETLLGGYIIINGKVKETIQEKGGKGMKFVAIENALDVFCKDYFYDVESNRKKNIRNHRG
ncbi:Imm43 family immunity protein [Klebsiella aerogenes]|uniref:Imm43 family immunity protein n=2 Tax=Klebsiella aerogenes TaxID=548 RepID=UPI000F7E6BE9|nr:Imm43 family immunity protein [Klebsiella aerogenes]MCU6422084.1 hypothetical protein [Klebsiella aerogenes]RSV82638.1 hypothetical protein EGH57_22285 [Klebsiella aerogenes]HEM8662621.1 hypothetical protein [Klebsiella aerogenes]